MQVQLAIREVVNIVVNDEVDVRVCTSYVFVAVCSARRQNTAHTLCVPIERDT